MSSNEPQTPEQQIQQAIDSAATPSGFPLEVSIPGTPQKFTGNTPQEVLDQLVNAQANATRTISEERAKRAELESQLTQLRSQIPAPAPNADEQQKKIQDRYNTWAQNPTEATRQDLADLLGLPANRVVEVMKEAIGAGVVNRAADEFTMRCPDFPQTQQTAGLMRDALAARFGSSMDAATADNLEVVYHQLVREGKITPTALPPTRLENAPTPIPNLRGSSSPPSPELELRRAAYTMPLADLKKAIESVTQR